MLEFLVCPVTRGPLVYDAERQELVSSGAGLAFPINNGIPVMLIDEARRPRRLNRAAWRHAAAKEVRRPLPLRSVNSPPGLHRKSPLGAEAPHFALTLQSRGLSCTCVVHAMYMRCTSSKSP